MSSRLIEKVPLPNGLVLELWDQSRRLAGDRWLVSLLARIQIPLLPDYFSHLDNGPQVYQDLLAAYGERLDFTQEKARHFVDAHETKDVLTGLCQRFKDNLLSYLGNPKFAALYAMKKYGDLQDRQQYSSTMSQR